MEVSENLMNSVTCHQTWNLRLSFVVVLVHFKFKSSVCEYSFESVMLFGNYPAPGHSIFLFWWWPHFSPILYPSCGVTAELPGHQCMRKGLLMVLSQSPFTVPGLFVGWDGRTVVSTHWSSKYQKKHIAIVQCQNDFQNVHCHDLSFGGQVLAPNAPSCRSTRCFHPMWSPSALLSLPRLLSSCGCHLCACWRRCAAWIGHAATLKMKNLYEFATTCYNLPI